MTSACHFQMPDPHEGVVWPPEADLHQVYNARLRAMSGTFSTDEDEPPPADPEVGELVAALASTDPLEGESAAIVAGLCRASEPEGDARIEAALRAILGGSQPVPLRTQSAFALARRGHVDAMRGELTRLSQASDPYDEPFRAALALAELGSANGFEVVAAAARGPVQADRGFAVRGLWAFARFIDQDGLRKRIGALLEEVAVDPNPMVRREMPTAVQRLGLEELAPTLRRLATDDGDSVVRMLARDVLDGWGAP